MKSVSALVHVGARNSRRLRGRVKLVSVHVDGIAPSAVVRAVQKAAVGRPSDDERQWLTRIELMRSLLLTSPVPLELADLGAGAGARFDDGNSEQPKIVRKTLGEMTLSSKPRRWAYLLFRILREFKPDTVLEMGACVGISASYQAAALQVNGTGRIVTLEGAKPLAERSARTLAELDLDDRAEVRLGRFSDTLGDAISDLKPVGFAFIDGNHVEGATIDYMEVVTAAAADEAVLVFDDINWSAGMRSAWKRIAADERFALTLDLRSVGIAVVSKSATRRVSSSVRYY